MLLAIIISNVLESSYLLARYGGAALQETARFGIILIRSLHYIIAPTGLYPYLIGGGLLYVYRHQFTYPVIWNGIVHWVKQVVIRQGQEYFRQTIISAVTDAATTAVQQAVQEAATIAVQEAAMRGATEAIQNYAAQEATNRAYSSITEHVFKAIANNPQQAATLASQAGEAALAAFTGGGGKTKKNKKTKRLLKQRKKKTKKKKKSRSKKRNSRNKRYYKVIYNYV